MDARDTSEYILNHELCFTIVSVVNFFISIDEQIRTGHDWLKSLVDESGLKDVNLGVRLTVHGFLCLFRSEASGSEEIPDDLNGLIDYFKSNPKPIEDLNGKLQEHLVLIALYVSEEEYSIPAGGPLD